MLRSLIVSLFYQTTNLTGPLSRAIPAKWLELNTLRIFLRDQGINAVLDVGANEGQFAAKLRRLGFKGLIISFEPDPRAFRLLRERHGKDPLWQGHQIALGEVESEATLHQANRSDLSSFLTPIRSEIVSSDARVKLRRLDSVFDEVVAGLNEPRVLLKTDTQGFDLHVLAGARACWEKTRGILAEISIIPIYENSPRVEEALSAYRDAGFDLVDFTVVNRTPDGRILEIDGLFVRRPAPMNSR